MPATPQSLVADSFLQTYGGVFGTPLNLLQATQAIEAQTKTNNDAKLQSALPALISAAKGKAPEEVFQMFAPYYGVDAAAKVVKGMFPQQDRNGLPTGYRWNSETGKAELIPGIPDPDVAAAKKSAIAFENQQRMLDARENKKAKNAFIRDAQSAIGYINLGLDHRLTFEEAKAEAERRWPSDDGESQAAAPVAAKGGAPVAGAKKGKDGNWYVEKDGKFFRVKEQ